MEIENVLAAINDAPVLELEDDAAADSQLLAVPCGGILCRVASKRDIPISAVQVMISMHPGSPRGAPRDDQTMDALHFDQSVPASRPRCAWLKFHVFRFYRRLSSCTKILHIPVDAISAPRFAGAPSAWLDVHKPNERAIGADLIARFNIIDDAIAGIGGGGGCVMDDSLLGMDP